MRLDDLFLAAQVALEDVSKDVLTCETLRKMLKYNLKGSNQKGQMITGTIQTLFNSYFEEYVLQSGIGIMDECAGWDYLIGGKPLEVKVSGTNDAVYCLGSRESKKVPHVLIIKYLFNPNEIRIDKYGICYIENCLPSYWRGKSTKNSSFNPLKLENAETSAITRLEGGNIVNKLKWSCWIL